MIKHLASDSYICSCFKWYFWGHRWDTVVPQYKYTYNIW